MNALEAARHYCDNGWRPIPVPFKSKAPVVDAWETLRIDAPSIPQHFKPPTNVGVLLGEPSEWLVDIDLDCKEAIQLAPRFLPSTLPFGRASKPRSHLLYVAPESITTQYRDPSGMIVELRSTGAQTVFPGSIHESGEPIEFEDGEERPRGISAGELKGRVAQLATAALLMRAGVDEAKAIEAVATKKLPPLLAKVAEKAREWLGITAPRETPRTHTTSDIDLESRIKRARAYVEKMPSAVSGQGGHQATFNVALVLVRGFDLPEHEALAILERDYNPRCDPPWKEKELSHKIRDAGKSQKVGRGWLIENSNRDYREYVKGSTATAEQETQEESSEEKHDSLTIPIAEFLGDESEADAPDEWLIDRMLPEGVVAFLAGLPKSKKTWVAILAGIAVATGRELFGQFKCKQGPVVIVTEEDTVKQIRRRLWWLSRGVDVDPRTLPMRVSALKGFHLDNKAHLAKLEEEAKGAKLVVLDALTRVHGVDENSRTEMQVVTQALQQLAARTGATILVIHHMRKRSGQEGDSERAGQRMRGTGDLHALARAVISAEKRKDGATELGAESNYGEDLEPFAVELHIEPPVEQELKYGEKRRAWFEHKGSAEDATAEKNDAVLLDVLGDQDRPQSKTELRALVGGDAREVDAAIKRLARNGRIELVDAEKVDSRGRTIEFKGWKVTKAGGAK